MQKNVCKIIYGFGLLIFLFAFSGFKGGKEKKYPFERWTKEEYEKANSAKDAAYLSDEEKKVIFYANLVRINPKLFGLTYARKYMDSANLHSSYCNSLLNELKKADSLHVLLPDSMLSKTAARHAKLSGKLRTTGHGGKLKRFSEVMDEYNVWGENCSYGYNQALDIIMQLLIDEKVPSRGHRKNILNTRFTNIGTGIRKHGKYRWNCVQDFGGKTSK